MDGPASEPRPPPPLHLPSASAAVPPRPPSPPAPPPLPPLRADVARLVAFEGRAATISFALHTLTQLRSLACPWSQLWQRLLSIPMAAAVPVWALWRPRSYARWRVQVLIASRLVFFAFPLLRQPVGIQRVLDAPATPGAAGFVLDVVKMAWGARLFAVLLSGLTLRLPLVLFLACQLWSVAMVRSNASLCASRLMRDPLTAARVRSFNVLSSAVLLPPAGQAVAGAGSPAGAHDCSLFLTILALLLSVLLPTALLVSARDYGLRAQAPSLGDGRGAAARAVAALESAQPWRGRPALWRAWILWLSVQVLYAVAVLTSSPVR